MVPPLRARGGDALLIAQKLLQRFAEQARKNVTSISPEAALRIRQYPWPGNIRELSNCMERAVALARFEQILAADLPDKVKGAILPTSIDDDEELVVLEEIERRYILRAFERLGRNKSLTAQTLGVDRKTLYRKLERWGALGQKS